MYSYKGYDAASGANVKGRIDADSERSARATLRQRQKIIVAEIKEEKASTTKSSGLSLTQRGVSLDELSVMVRQFATLQNAYVPVDESLKALVSQVDNDALRNTLSSVKDMVSEGKSLAEASSTYPNIFNKLYINMVKAGESSGTLGLVLERLADFMEYQVQVRGRIVQAMVYPSIMIVASLSIVVFLLVVIVPKLAKVFQSMKVQVPWYTELLINFSGFLNDYWFIPPVLLVVGFILGRSWLNSPKGRRKFDHWLISAPILGPVFMMLAVSRFTKTLSTMLSSGVPIIPALDITKNVVNNMILTEVLEQAKIDVQEGNSLASTINKSGVFPGLVTHMIATGEKTGEMVTMLAHVAKAYDAEVERKITKLVTLIEPIMMFFLMIIAVGVIVGMIMPMMDIMKQIK
ncbi:type II secretion system F family protein [Oligoflexus tunisiensis]|uniref:type II secretion system F family protein n=1 Tax=Oligoflexus tunisiensis TaxID=708132 RepID=UPI001C40708E|nr:type II secretion system F family protein [Oligoflexus tunisiensis]